MTQRKITPVRTTLLPSLLLGCGVLCASVTAHAQAFDCRYARSPDERAICSDPRLGRLDLELNTVFGRQYQGLPSSERARLDNAEDAWLAARRRCAGDSACIEQSYRRRIEELGGGGHPAHGIEQPQHGAIQAPEQNPAARPEQHSVARPEQGEAPRPEQHPTTHSEYRATAVPEQRVIVQPQYGTAPRPEQGGTARPEYGAVPAPERRVIVELQYRAAPPPEQGATARPESGDVPAPEQRVITQPQYRAAHPPEQGAPARPEQSQTARPEEGTAARPEQSVVARPEQGRNAPPQQNAASAREQGTAAQPDRSTAAQPEQRAVARPVRPEEVEVTEEPERGKSHHRSRKAGPRVSPVSNAPTRAEASKALRSAKEEEREQHLEQRQAEHPKATVAPAPSAENPSPGIPEKEAAPKKANRGRQHAPHNAAAASAPGHSSDTANPSSGSASANSAPKSGTNAAPPAAEPQKNNAAPSGSRPSISWVNPPPASGQ